MIRLGDVMRETGIGDAQLARQLDLNRDHVRAIRLGTARSFKRRELESLMSWAHERGQELLTLEPHPIWRDFRSRTAVVYRGQSPLAGVRKWDASAEHLLTQQLERLNCGLAPAGTLRGQISRNLRAQNCIVIGSPKHNPVTGEVLNHLAQQRIRFVWPEERGETFRTKLLAGIYIGAHRRHRSLVRWRPYAEYIGWSGHGVDAGLVVAHRRPRPGGGTVTTLVIAGYTGFATVETARAFVTDTPDMDEEELAGPAAVRLLRIDYFKHPKVDRRDLVSRPTWLKSPGMAL